MKLQLRFFLIAALLAAFAQTGYSQMVGTNTFLQGRWLEIGLLNNASFGAPSPPAGYHPFPAGSALAEVYDLGHDGWTVGTPPYNGDYTYPGSPFEGWELQIGGTARSQAFAPSTTYVNVGGATLTGGALSYSNVGGRITGTWSGSASAGGLQMRQETRVDTLASWVVVTTYFKNLTAAAIPDVYYMRSCDPDNDEAHGGSIYFSTSNTVVYQNDVDHRVMVDAFGTLYNDHFSLCTKDCRAKAFIYTSWPLGSGTDLSTIWSGTYGVNGSTVQYTAGGVLNGDVAIGLVYKIGTIAPNDSAVISYAYVFNGISGIDSAFPEPQLVVNGVPKPPSGPAPAPTYDTFNTCMHPGVTVVPVSIANASDKCWTWSKWTWTPSVGLATTTGLVNSINTSALTGPTTYMITGTDSNANMFSCNMRVFFLTVLPCFNASSNSPGDQPVPGGPVLCVTDTIRLEAHGDSLGATYAWYGPGLGGTYRGGTQYINMTGLSMTDTGWYYVIRTRSGASDTARAHVMLKPLPIIVATSNSPICSGSLLELYSNPDSVGETWVWTGPAGFYSTLSDPTRPSALTMYSGTYWVKATFKGCTDSAFVNVVVDSTPETPVAISNSPVCTGDTLKLFGSDATSGVMWAWAGPNGFVSGLQNPKIPNVHTPAAGVYTLTARNGMCTASVTTTVAIDSTPLAPTVGSNSPVCSGNALNLTASTLFGSTYHWSGPNGFSSVVQNPTISPATTLASGTYTVYATKAGCTSPTSTIVVVVDSTPVTPTASSNSPGLPGPILCQGDTLRLYSSTPTAGVTYSWTGPNSFTSTQQNPIIPNVSPLATGLYQVTVTLAGACSTSVIISVTITPTPPLSASSNSPVCSGDTLKLTTVTSPGSTFSWEGPYTFFSSQPNPIRTPASTEYSGVYTVTITLNNCTNMVRDTVLVNRTPNPPGLVWLTYCEHYDAPPLQAHGDLGSTILWYPDSKQGTVGSTIGPVPPTANDTVMWFFATQTVKNCKSAIDSMKVTVNPKPSVTASMARRLCPHDTATLSAVSADASGSFHWYPRYYLSDTTGPIVVTMPETDLTYTVILTNGFGCTDTAQVPVTVRPNGTIYLKDSATIFPGESYQLNPQTNCTSLTWFPPSGLDNPFIVNPVATPLLSTKYVVTGVTAEGCVVKDSINIYVSTESLLALPNAFVPGSSANGTFKILKRGQAVLKHFRIYDRWGMIVFETTDIDKGWDGTFKDMPQPMGVYIYDVEAVTSTGRVFSKTGNVTLVR